MTCSPRADALEMEVAASARLSTTGHFAHPPRVDTRTPAAALEREAVIYETGRIGRLRETRRKPGDTQAQTKMLK
jgi:hypothetical protein